MPDKDGWLTPLPEPQSEAEEIARARRFSDNCAALGVSTPLFDLAQEDEIRKKWAAIRNQEKERGR